MAVSPGPSPPRVSTVTKTNDMVTIKVGPEPTIYCVHKDLLVHHSDYFRKALKECWREGEERSVTLDDLEPPAFDVFVDWLYTKKVPQKKNQWLEDDSGDPEDSGASYRLRVELLRLKTYVVADRLGIQDLVNAVNNNYVDNNINEPPFYAEIVYAFANIPSGRSILRFMAATHCRWSELSTDKDYNGEENFRESLPHDFLLLVLQKYQEWRGNKDWDEDLKACEFHEHMSEEEKEQCSLSALKALL